MSTFKDVFIVYSYKLHITVNC